MKKGFTLAEVLITLGVIGVVAALTMPNLLQNHQKKVFVTQLQRTVNLISNSATQLMSDENAPTLADTYLVAATATDEDGKITRNYKDAQGKFMNKYFKVARDCGTENQQACLGETYYSLDRSESTTIRALVWSSIYCVTINTGATICMSSMWPDEIYTWEHNGNIETQLGHGNAYVLVDVNGPSGPNTNGRDLFQFELYSDGRMNNSYAPGERDNGQGYEYHSSGKQCQDWKSYAGYGGSCFQHLQANGWVMDY